MTHDPSASPTSASPALEGAAARPRPPLLPGMVPSGCTVLHEKSRPDFPDAFASLLVRATRVSTAVTRVRLRTLAAAAPRLAALDGVRVVVAELNALQVDAEARGLGSDPDRRSLVGRLADMLERGALEVRSAPLGGWSPDFSVFSDEAGPLAVLAGYHWLERPYPHRGPALATLSWGDAARLAERRYSDLWEAAHDVGPALWSLLARARERGGAGDRRVG